MTNKSDYILDIKNLNVEFPIFGGIVQHEYFLGSTPVIAYKTGGLKDTVFEFDWKTNKGNGCNFDVYTSHELKMAIERAIKLCNNQ